jgi:hypothetical protein
VGNPQGLRLRIRTARNEAENFIAFAQQQLGQVGAVLTGNARD